MPTDPLEYVLEAAQQSGLISGPDRDKITREWPNKPSTIQDVAARLVEQKVLTPYQGDQLVAAQGEKCVLAGRYHLLEKLGEGGMGAVYKARDTKLDRVVALKVMAPHHVNNLDAVARFHREAKALAKVSHPAIVQAYDTGEDGDRHFLVMEYVEGTNLARVLHERGRLPATQAADYLYQAALGLQQAHDRGLVHRDMKPANLLLTPQGQIKILDLGLARFVQDQIGDGTLTHEGMGLGTPDYMAPEQFRDARHVDPRADVYALGCTLYHLLTGRVPFPGSSLSEKANAHESREPAAVEDYCPEAPAGLALAVRQMMAKNPADRFQTAEEAAEALAPYVSASSSHFKVLKSTANWTRGQLTLSQFQVAPKRRRQWLAIAAGSAAAALLIVGAVLLFWPPREPPAPGPNGNLDKLSKKDPPSPEKRRDPPPEKKDDPAKKPVAAEAEDANVLTVSQDPKDGGKFRTITEALDEVKPGMIIRVLDSATYNEMISITRASLHTGIALESPRRATITHATDKAIVSIYNVPGVTLRGFRIQGEKGNTYLVGVVGKSPGVHLEQLTLEPGRGANSCGLTLEMLDLEKEEPPVVVQHCIFRRLPRAIRISGLATDLVTPQPCKGVVIRHNDFADCGGGCILSGQVQRIHVVANRFFGNTVSAMQFGNLSEKTQDILIANNTVFESFWAFSLIADAARAIPGRNIQIRNNLFVGGKGLDMVFFDSGSDPKGLKGPAEGNLVPGRWRLDHNWREVKVPDSADPFRKAWIPPGDQDVRKDRLDVLPRIPGRADFLRPPKDSPLATDGAGKTDPGLPSYIGAIPPEGADPWDWNRTWLVPPPGVLLTVSQDAKDGGQFRTITEALAKAQPWTTIRVLDKAIYPEPLILARASLHTGITLEAPRQATLAPPGARVVVFLSNVPHVTLRGFKIRAEAQSAFLVAVVGKCPGVLVERLDLDRGRGDEFRGVSLEKLDLSGDDPPVIVRHCVIHRAVSGIRVSGMAEDYRTPHPCRRISIRNNTLLQPGVGIILMGAARQVQVVGNKVLGATLAAIQFENLMEVTEDVLVANNSVFESATALRIWDQASKGVMGNHVHLLNNLIVDAKEPDMVFLDSGGNLAKMVGPGDGALVRTRWNFSHNWREVQPPEKNSPLAKAWIPPGPTDVRLDRIADLKRDPGKHDFLRPAPASRLATQGAGTKHPGWPIYVGAVPPEGVEPWDWDWTWRRFFPKKAGKDP